MAQIFDVVTVADQQLVLRLIHLDAGLRRLLFAFDRDLFFLAGLGVLPIGHHAGVGIAVCDRKAMPVPILASQLDGWQGLTAGGRCLSRLDEQQAAGFDRRNGIELVGQAGEEGQIALVGLVDMVDELTLERSSHAGGEAVAGGQLTDDAVDGHIVPTALAQLVHVTTQVCRLAPDGEHVRGAAVLHLVDGIGALVYQGTALPANQGLQLRTSSRQGQLAVGVIEGELNGVNLKTPVVSQGEADQSGANGGGNILAIDQDLVSRGAMLVHVITRP
ncbi:hypothetical protein D3C85_682340 [compost metagenome]